MGQLDSLSVIFRGLNGVVMLKRSEDNPVTKPYINKMGPKALTQEKDKAEGPFVSKVGSLP